MILGGVGVLSVPSSEVVCFLPKPKQRTFSVPMFWVSWSIATQYCSYTGNSVLEIFNCEA